MATTARRAFAPLLAVVPLIAGCSGSTSSNVNRTLVRAGLDDCHDVQLQHRAAGSRDGWQPEECYEQITVRVEPREFRTEEYALQRARTSEFPSSSHFQFERVEVRSDPGRQRIWFVDRTSGKVIGTVNRETRATTGPGDLQPAWATADGGERLK